MSWPDIVLFRGRGRARILAGAAMLVLAGALRAEVGVGDPFPALNHVQAETPLPTVAGHVTLVDFWASWCAPCKASFPVYSRLQSEFATGGLVIIGVSVDDDAAARRAFVRRMAPTFATGADARHDLAATVQVPAMPTSYLIGRDGRVRYVHVGFHGSETEREIRREIETLLAEGKSPS
ncbi:MAG TPA: TlpA disulfide reductase family protein [Candidatus Didemnitutus sp.]|jgi:thiol-disulfide isomerase/thioredoxin